MSTLCNFRALLILKDFFSPQLPNTCQSSTITSFLGSYGILSVLPLKPVFPVTPPHWPWGYGLVSSFDFSLDFSRRCLTACIPFPSFLLQCCSIFFPVLRFLTFSSSFIYFLAIYFRKFENCMYIENVLFKIEMSIVVSFFTLVFVCGCCVHAHVCVKINF